MVSYVDICLFSQNLATTQRLSRDEFRDMTTFNIEEEQFNIEEELVAVALDDDALKSSFIPVYNGQYHIDFWLSQVEFLFVNSFVPKEKKCDYVASYYFSEDVRQAYDNMQWSRIRRGEAIINDWPTLKTLLRCVFLPLTEQLHTTVSLNHLPSRPSKKKIISTTTQQPPAATDLLRMVESLSLSSCSCSNNNKIHDKHERDVKSLKKKMADFQFKLAEIQDVLNYKHERDVQSWKKWLDDSLAWKKWFDASLARQDLLGPYGYGHY